MFFVTQLELGPPIHLPVQWHQFPEYGNSSLQLETKVRKNLTATDGKGPYIPSFLSLNARAGNKTLFRDSRRSTN